jgi:hypothetical protein
MIDRNLARGLFLAAIALTFGLNSLRYKVGDFSHAGPGLFPLMISSMLLALAVAMMVRSLFVEREALHFPLKNILLLLASLCSFALASHFVNMALGIVVMVFISTFAGQTYSVWRNVKIAAALIAVAFAFQQLLGLSLPLL